MGVGKSRFPPVVPDSSSIKASKALQSIPSSSSISSTGLIGDPHARASPSNMNEFMSSKSEMKACYYKREGCSSTLLVGNVPLPTPKENQILVRVLAAAVNPYDIKMRANHISSSSFRHEQSQSFKITGVDFSGIVVDISSCADSVYDVGDMVYGMCSPDENGSAAEYVCVHQDHVALAPKRARSPYFTEAEIASLPTVGLTVLEAFEPYVLHCAKQVAKRNRVQLQEHVQQRSISLQAAAAAAAAAGTEAVGNEEHDDSVSDSGTGTLICSYVM